MSNKYEISLGVKLDTSNLQQQVNTAGDNIKPIDIKVDAETKELTKTINDALKKLSNGTKDTLTLDTSKLENSLKEVKDAVVDIKNAFGSLGDKSGMQSLLSSVNQIATTIGRVTDETDTLVKSLNALSKKDFNINLGIDMNKKGLNTIGYGRAARKQVIPQLEEQAKYLENLLGGQQSAVTKLAKNKNIGFDIFTDFSDFNSESAIKKMEAMEKYINSLKKLASIENIKLDGFNDQFSKGATELINDITGIENAVDKTGDVPQKLKNLFGSGIDAENLTIQLDSVVKDLGEIKNAIKDLSSGISLEGLTSSFDRLSDSIEQLVKNCTTAKQAINDSIGSGLGGSNGNADSGVKNLNNDLKQVTITADNTADAIDSMKNAMSSMKFNSSSIDAITKDLEEMNIVIKEVTAKQGKNFDITVKGINDVGEAVEIIRRFNAETGNFEIISQKISKPFNEGAEAAKRFKKEADLVKDIEFNFETDKYHNQISKIDDDFNKLSSASDELRTSVEQVHNAYRELELAYEGTGDEVADKERLIQAEKEYHKALQTTNNLIKIQVRAEKADNDRLKLDDDIRVFQQKIDTWLTKNSAASQRFGAELRDLQAQAKNCDRVTLNHLEKEFKRIDSTAEQAGLKMQSFGDRISSKFKEYMAYFSVAEVFMYAEQALRSMFDQVVAIDSAMTELKKVTDESASSYDRFLTNAASKAREIGTTVDGLVESTADFARLGYDFADAQGLAEVANIYAVVGDEIDSVETATQSLISTLTAFKDEANGLSDSDFALSIVDKMNEVSNNFAISSGGIGEALQRSASSMMAANNSLDETIALITAANTVVQDPDTVGTAFKTMSMRIRGAKTELEEAGLETDGMASSTAKLREEILALSGVDIMLNNNEFKSTYQIMEELADKWQDLSDIQQATVTELIAGKRQGNIVSSLMNNFDIAEQALETSLNSAGSAMKEHEKWQQSLEAQILKLKAAWQGLSQAFLSSDFLKGALDGIIALVDIVTELIDTIGAIPTLFAGFGLFKLGKKGLGSLFGVKTSDSKLILDLAKSMGLLGENAGKSTGLLGKAGSALKNMVSKAGGATGALKGVGSALLGLVTSHPYIAAAAVAVGVLTSAFISQKKEAEELAKKVEETVSSYKEQHHALMNIKDDYDASKEDSMISKYGELSKGVDGLGRNISLTADEYSEYQGIVNTIAEQIPSLVSGYDEQGNAMLSCKGNVEQLAEAYEKLVHAQNNEILSNVGNIEKDFANTLDEADSGGWDTFWQALIPGGKNSRELNKDAVKVLEDIYSGVLDGEGINNALDGTGLGLALTKDDRSRVKIQEALEQAGIEIKGDVDETLKNLMKQDPQKIKGIIDDYYSQFADAVEEQKTIAQAKLSEAFDVSSAISGLDYSNIGKELQDIAYQTVNSLDYDFFSKLSESGKSVEQWITEMLNQLNAIGKADNAKIEAAFDLQTKFNGGDISYGEYVKSLRDVESTIDKLNLKSEAKEQLKISLGLDENGVVEQYEALVKRLTSKEIGLDDKAARKFLDGLSAEEFDVAMDIIPKLDAGTTVSEIQKLIDEKLADEFTFDITVQMEGIEAFNTALSEARSATGLTAESITALKGRYEDLDGFNAGALFERTANGVRLNNEELARLEAQYENVNKLDINKNLNTLAGKYKELTEKIKTCTDAQEKESLQLQADAYADKIEDLRTLSAQYDGLASAFSKWQQAQSSPNDGDNYDSIFESLEALQESYKAGLVGTDDFRAAVQLMSNEDLSTASIDALVSAYKDGLPKMKRYFTEGQKGCKNFLNDLSKINSEWAHLNEKGEWEINIDVEEAAKKLDMDVSTIYLILDKLKDYGFEINIDDSSLGDVKTEIEKTEARLKELGQAPHKVNLDASDVKTIDSEIENLKKHISEVNNNASLNVETKTAELDDARAKLEALIQKKQEASQPTFMNLDTSQVKSSMVEALGYVQEYQNSLDNLNMLLELKEAGITIDDSEIDAAQKKLDECAKLIQGLDSEVKLAIGLKEDASIDDIKKAITNGDIVIDTDTSTANIKIEKLAENVERIEDKDVTINVTVNGLDDVEELNKQIDLATNIDGDIDKLSKYVESAKKLSALDDNITSYVTANIDGNVKDTPEFCLNNLEVFAEGAKALQDVGTFSSKVTADVDGNVITTPEYSINNLKVFSDSAANVEEIGNVASKVTADVSGNVVNTKEYKINNLKTYVESAKDVYKIGNVESNVKATVNTGEDGDVVDTFEYKLNNLSKFAEHASALQGLNDVDISVDATVNTGEDGDVIDEFEYKLDNLGKFADNVTKLQGLPEETNISVTASINSGKDGDVIDEFEYKLDNLSKFADYVTDLQGLENVDISVDATVNTGKDGDVVEEFEYKLDNLGEFAKHVKELQGLDDVEVNVIATVNSGEDGDVIDEFEYKLNNLSEFAKHAKELQGLNDIDVSISAKVNTGEDGDVIDTFEHKLNNLGEFAENVKDLQGLDSIDISVSAKVNTGETGDVVDTFEYKLNNLSEFAKHVKALQGLEDADVSVNAEVNGDVIWHPEGMLNNLSTFAESAKELADIESVSRSVTANIDGDVVWHPEGMLNNLKEFAKGARELADTSNVSRKIEANIDGDVVWYPEGMLNNVSTFAESAKELESISDVSRKITANIDGDAIWHPEGMLNNLKEFAEGAKTLENIPDDISKTITANIDGDVIWTPEGMINNVETFAKSAKLLDGVESPSVTVTANISGNVTSTSEDSINKIGVFADNAKKAKDVGNFTSSVAANISGNIITDNTAVSDLEHFVSIVSGMSNQTVTVNVTANVDSANINQAITLLTNVSSSGVFKDYKATVQVGAKIATIDDTTVKNYKAPTKDGKVKYTVDSTAVDNWSAPTKDGTVNYSAEVEALTNSQKHKTGTITYKAKVTGFPVVNGTANVNGTAFVNGTSGKALRQGDWGAKRTETALTGELGRELVVYKNRYWTVGDNGAEFATIPKGAIVFNHKQTEELFKNGRVTSDGGRGRAFANGNAFLDGNAFLEGTAYNNISSGGGKLYNSSTGESYGSTSDSDSSKDFEEVLDWVEVIIDRVERAIDRFEQQANNIYKSWSSRNKALQNQISEVNNEISVQQKAYNKYMEAANSVGLSSSWATKVRNGEININTITDEVLADKIKSYTEWYEKALDCQDAIEELKETEAKLYAQRIENVATQYEGILGVIEHEKNMIEEYISQSEANAQLISGEYYKALINNENKTITQLQKQKNSMLAELKTAMESGSIAKGSEAWYSIINSIDEVTLSIAESQTQIKEWNQTIQQLSWETFDLLQDKISAVTEESDFLIELMSNDKLHDDNGKLTDEGSATMGLHGQNYNTYMYQADLAAKEAERLKKQMSTDGYDTELEERYREMISLQQEYILNAEDEKNAIRDLVSDGIELELDALQELIDKKNEELESERDLYEYQKKVLEQTKEISSLEKQIASYSSDDSEEAKAKIQELKVSLEEAKADLEETEYDKYISDQSAMLDELYLEYETILNARLDNLDALVEQVVAQINMDATSINTTLSEKADSVGYKLSDSMTTIWDTNSTKINSVITTYGEKFTSAQTTTNNALNTINSNLQKMITQLNSMAKTNTKSASTSSAANSKEANAKKKTTTTTTKKPAATTNTPKSITVGGMVNASGAQIYDYAGDTSGERQLYRNDPKYKVLRTDGNWIQVRWHKLSSGVTGWFKKSDVSAYATGKKDFLSDEIAWTQDGGKEFIVRPSDGAILTPIAKGDSVLNANASSNIWNMANTPSEFIRDNLNLGIANVPNNSNVNNNITQNVNANLNFPNIKNYEEMLISLSKDPKFEKLVNAMTTDQYLGKSSLAKGKTIR